MAIGVKIDALYIVQNNIHVFFTNGGIIMVMKHILTIVLLFSVQLYGADRYSSDIPENLNDKYTVVFGAVSGTWTKENSPYLAINDITLSDGDRLVIEPGVEVYFDEQCRFLIGMHTSGQLIAKGTETDSILFTAFDVEKKWWGISFVEDTQSDDTLQYCIIKNIQLLQDSRILGEGAVRCTYAAPVIKNSLFCDNDVDACAVLTSMYTTLTISNCVFTRNNNERGRIFDFLKANVTIENCLFYNNTGSTFMMSNYTSLVTYINVTISNNTYAIKAANKFGGKNYTYFFNSIIHNNNTTDWWSFFTLLPQMDHVVFNHSSFDTSVIPIDSSFIELEDGNIFDVPLFNDMENGDYTLRSDSPCIDAGDMDEVYYDIEDPENPGQALWPSQGTVRNDMGAYGGQCPLGTVNITNVNVVDDGFNDTPEHFMLCNNYPNPFNPETAIDYVLPERTFVTFTIYNMLGQKIKTLVNDVQPGGRHTARWDGYDMYGNPVSSGIYIYRIEAGEYIRAKKMTLMR